MQPITLAEMGKAELLNRKDTKFFFPAAELGGVLADLKDQYRILEVDGQRITHYSNIYFDTPDRNLYLQHHNERLNRYKIRIRKYSSSNIAYFEIKFKSNQGRTIKNRMRVDPSLETMSEETAAFLRTHSQIIPESIQPVLHIEFDRITLVSNDLMERATLDLNMTAINEHGRRAFDKIAIAELKQEGILAGSHFKASIRRHHGIEKRLSKYCICLSALESGLKQNKFKPKHLHIKKLEKYLNNA
jgi:hypothetical protein